MAIDAVEAEAVGEQNAKFATHASSSLHARGLVTPSQAANQNDEAHRSLATLLAGIFRRAGDDTQIPGEARSGHSEDGTDWGEPRDTWVTELLTRASVDNDGQDVAPRWAPTQNGGANQHRR